MNSYLELLKAKAHLVPSNNAHTIELLVLNNITTNPLKDYIEYNCALNQIKANITFGDYDNISQNALEFDLNNKVILIFWELANCLHGLEYKIDGFSVEHITALEQKIQSELRLTFGAISKASLVIMNRFTALPFSYQQTQTGALEQLAMRLNAFCDQYAPKSIKWINTDKCLVQSGIENSIDFKGYLKNKLLYKHGFYVSYMRLIQPYFNAVTGQVKKLLALDCDNTLWKGILGEDGFDHIAMDENTYKGQSFAAAQYRALALGKKGVLVALASKNNPEDVDKVLETHSELTLNNDALVAKKVNWEPKSENLKRLAGELNIGVDSFVFVDDSDFEVQLMRDQVPSVHTIQVPKNAVQYYVQQQQWVNYFVQLNETQEDAKKLDQYKQNVQRANAEGQSQSFEAFLESLELQLTIHKNDKTLIARMAQMSQKTNQFNLTTPRYTESQIAAFVDSDAYDCFAFSVKDKFGDSGITGLCIVHYINKQTAHIDALLMSCRILGRTVEYRFLDEVLTDVFSKTAQLNATYKVTNKNAQVADFYSKIGFEQSEQTETMSLYSMKKATFTAANAYNYITLHYA
ncbi:HAD-IIIC family phosphatase [Winogradskyella eckloniae]|uniref:HAD-IIIC family phosphatase n=1 Tax=Winogradskyella eckloniae TaxID=1089306 RepID=UPI001564CF5C|nr:HAD-IIIC family phosphatase [Winogradskyella eckloniae]NRD20809.1 HAD-IIIC family phosphatase [Winogradskyella eckloniae]